MLKNLLQNMPTTLWITSVLLVTGCADLAYLSKETEVDTIIRVKPDAPCTKVSNEDINVVYNCD